MALSYLITGMNMCSWDGTRNSISPVLDIVHVYNRVSMASSSIRV